MPPLNLVDPSRCFCIQRWTVRSKRTYKPEGIVVRLRRVDVLHPHFSLERHLNRRDKFNQGRAAALAKWLQLAA
jgi:hypothetical protein